MERSRTVRYAWHIIPLASIVPAVLDAGQMWLMEAMDRSPGIHWGNVTERRWHGEYVTGHGRGRASVS